MPPRVPVDWILREADAADRDGILRLRERAFAREDPEKRDPAFWSWEFLGGNAGAARLFVAERNAVIVGHYAAIPQVFVVDHEVLTGSIVVDVMTDPAHRFQGMFKALGKHSMAALASSPIRFATGYPIRREVMPGHLAVGWQALFRIPVLVRPLYWKAVLSRYHVPGAVVARSIVGRFRAARAALRGPATRGWEVRSIAHDDRDALDDLLSDAHSDVAIHQRRSWEFFAWRYYASPVWRYDVRGAFRNGRLLAYVVSRAARLLDVASLAIVDLGARPGAESALDVLLETLVEEGTARELAVAGAMITSGNRGYRALRRAGFWPGPYRFTFIVYFIDRTLEGRLVAKPERWFLTWGDTDDV